MKAKPPKCSVNKLGEYLEASTFRRMAIIKEQMKPVDAIKTRYYRALTPVLHFLKSGDESRIRDTIALLRSEPSKGDWDKSDRSSTAQALETFLTFGSQLRMEDCSYHLGAMQERRGLDIAGVRVAIKPDIYIKKSAKNKKLIGAIKFHWIRDEEKKLTKKGGKAISTLSQAFMDKYFPDRGDVSPDLCLAVDVYRKAIHVAPGRNVMLMREITAACAEIVLHWKSLQGGA